MIAKAHEISLEAGSKMATAMKDVIFAAAGLTPFAVESAKDLINYMVRRGQMGAEEAERIIRDIEAAAEKRGGMRPPPRPVVKDDARPSFTPSFGVPPITSMPARPAQSPSLVSSPPAATKPVSQLATPKAAAKPSMKPKPAAKKPAAKKPAAKAAPKKKAAKKR
jgi:hypothetical protein